MCDCAKCNKACKVGEYLDTKKSSCQKCLLGKLVLACDDEILNTTEKSLDDKKVTCEKNNCLFHTISLVIMPFLLLSFLLFVFIIIQNKNIFCHITTAAIK